MYVLGLNIFHGDSSAALVKNGEIVAATEEERFNRIKHFSGFPVSSIKFCLAYANISLSQVEHIAVNSSSTASIFQRTKFLLTNIAAVKLAVDKLRGRAKKLSVNAHFRKHFPQERLIAKIHNVEHHLAHISSAYLESGFSKSVSVSIDGFGDFSSGGWGITEHGKVKIAQRIHFPHSLGIFYQALTQYLGFPNYGDEYKVMGLAPYGKPTFLEPLRKLVMTDGKGRYKLNLNYFRHQNTRVDITDHIGIPKFEPLFNKHLTNLIGIKPRNVGAPLLQSHKDLAHSVQLRFEEILFELLTELHRKYQCDNLTLSGGCAMNSVANGKIRQHTPFKNIYIPAAAGDAGGAVGAAYNVSNFLEYGKRRNIKQSAYWGPEFSDEDIALMLKTSSDLLSEENTHYKKYCNEEELVRDVAFDVSQGFVVGWFQGRMEWGPRALGNRSILGDPRRADMKDILNLKIKRRESFRPFAPSILRERVAHWFEDEDEVPYMMQVLKIKQGVRYKIPAVTHVDGSGRLHTVSKEHNKRYHKLISAFDKITGVPIVLNTSFNENEPIVCTPQEALNCFLRTKMDVLAINNFVLRRNHDYHK